MVIQNIDMYMCVYIICIHNMHIIYEVVNGDT